MIICIDGITFGDHVMIGAVRVDTDGHKHVLAIRDGATENATVVKELLEDVVARGVSPDHKRLFVIDGSKALRTAINAVFGSQYPVQRCRAHKLRNVMDHLPEDQKAQVKSAMQAAWQLDANEGHGATPKTGRMVGARLSFYRRQSIGRAWPRPTSLRAHMPAFACEPGGYAVGGTATW